ncbi:FUSC family protein [Humibacter sp.]|uniref:FUSC family protein n=1 Tax=Humibacter sp. TaxID=1940291 RepID=UPI002CBDDF86|nr:FUSC family protein [Humibacter sp.]HVX06492.1 FUSC family protein [Humibacter sp.]
MFRSTWRALGRSLADPGLLRLRTTAVTYLTVLISAATACVPAVLFGLGASIVVLAVMLSISFTSERAGTTAAQRWLSLLLLPLIGLAAGTVGSLMFQSPVIGDSLFVVVLSGAIWIRRFGRLATRIGTLVALPFVTVLVVPAPIVPGQGFLPWAAAIAFVVTVVTLGLQWAARASGFLPRPAHAGHVGRRGGGSVSSVRPSPSRPAMRPVASTRMAAQMAVTLSGAFIIGHVVFGEHWFWAVLTAFVVASGNRGRGDVVSKGIHRTVGAVGGTVLATVLSAFDPHGAETGAAAAMSVLAIAVILALGLWLRPTGYGWWAAAMTAMLSLLHGVQGTAPGPAMLVRLAAIVVAGAFAVAVAWWVLPVPTATVLRGRTSAALAALTELLVACIKEQDAIAERRAEFDVALTGLRQLGPTLRLERAARSIGGRARGADPRAVHRADVIPAIEACWDPADAIAADVEHGHQLSTANARELGALARRVGDCRRMLAGSSATASPPPERAGEAPEPPTTAQHEPSPEHEDPGRERPGHEDASPGHNDAPLGVLQRAIAALSETLPLIARS